MIFMEFILKPKIIFIVLVCGIAAMVSAQGWNNSERTSRIPRAENITVSGSLIITYGMPALKNGDTTYLLGGLRGLGGFIDGLKEGAQITIEGRAITSQKDSNLKILMPSKLSLGGKTYDLAPPEGGFGFMNQFSAPTVRPNFQRPNMPRTPVPDRRQLNPRMPNPRDARPNTRTFDRRRDL